MPTRWRGTPTGKRSSFQTTEVSQSSCRFQSLRDRGWDRAKAAADIDREVRSIIASAEAALPLQGPGLRRLSIANVVSTASLPGVSVRTRREAIDFLSRVAETDADAGARDVAPKAAKSLE
jgi:hypothetical protein